MKKSKPNKKSTKLKNAVLLLIMILPTIINIIITNYYDSSIIKLENEKEYYLMLYEDIWKNADESDKLDLKATIYRMFVDFSDSIIDELNDSKKLKNFIDAYMNNAKILRYMALEAITVPFNLTVDIKESWESKTFMELKDEIDRYTIDIQNIILQITDESHEINNKINVQRSQKSLLQYVFGLIQISIIIIIYKPLEKD